MAYRALKAGELNNRALFPLVSVKTDPLRFWLYWSFLFLGGLIGLTIAIHFILDLAAV
jgi:hypothetical protein